MCLKKGPYIETVICNIAVNATAFLYVVCVIYIFQFNGACQADLQDISSQDYPPLLKINQIVSSKETKNAIWKLLTSKVAGLDRILNKAIKAALEAVIILSANAVITCLYKANY